MIELMNSLGVTWLELLAFAIILIGFGYSVWKNGFLNTIRKIIVEVEEDYLNDQNIDKLEEAILRLNSKSIIIRFLVKNDYIRNIIEDLVSWARKTQPKPEEKK